MRAIIEVESVSKRYRIGMRQAPYSTLRETLADLFRAPFNGSRKNSADKVVWALKDVSFEVAPGEVVGIIGCNGAGKSTLLKVLSRITEPTNGRVKLFGRVGSLLEVGTGFHPELTGRENIYLNGAILGMKRSEIERKFDEIVAFAEVEKFLDTPVKYYSSGMYMRLAFSVAAHLEPEILLVDEVLAVGDFAFQKKCLGKMGDVAKEGRTVLFVSHNMSAVQRLCNRAIWLEEGKLASEGSASKVVSDYLSTSFSTLTDRLWGDITEAPGGESVRLRRACVRPERGLPSEPITVRTPFVLEFEYWNLEPGAYLNLGLHIFNEQGIVVFNTGPWNEPAWHGRPFPKGLFRSICHVPGDLLNDGLYRVQLLVVKNQRIIISRLDDVLMFNIRDADRQGYLGEGLGAVRPNLKWSTELIESLP
jgi:lipopolysaccharide transport system ATP-binding protein